MKEYCVYLKKTVVIEKWFSAENDDVAASEGQKIHHSTNESEFEYGQGSIEYDYSIIDENGRNIVYWG